jgi:hypothetical protein
MARYFKSNLTDAHADLTQGSKFMYQVSRPIGVNTGDVTTMAFSVYKHPTLDEYMAMIADITLNIHSAVYDFSQTSGNFPDQETFIDSPTESTRIRAILSSNGGGTGTVSTLDLVPARWIETTLDVLTEDGWFDTVL